MGDVLPSEGKTADDRRTESASRWRIVDSALVIGASAAALHLVGWAYYKAYLQRFGIDPVGMGIPSGAVAVEGLWALVEVLSEWFQSLLLVSIVLCVTFAVLDRMRVRRRWVKSIFGELGKVPWRTSSIGAGLLIVALAGDLAGKREAARQLAAVKQGNAWTYHLHGESISGNPLAQSGDRIWLLTAGGVRIVKLDEVSKVDGRLLERMKAGE